MFNWFAVATMSRRWQMDNNIWHSGPIKWS